MHPLFMEIFPLTESLQTKCACNIFDISQIFWGGEGRRIPTFHFSIVLKFIASSIIVFISFTHTEILQLIQKELKGAVRKKKLFPYPLPSLIYFSVTLMVVSVMEAVVEHLGLVVGQPSRLPCSLTPLLFIIPLPLIPLGLR